MKVTRQRKILVVLLGIGACALIADRLVAGSENPSAAAEPPLTAVEPEAPGANVMLTAHPSGKEKLLSGRIQLAAGPSPSSSDLRDAFRVSPAWSGMDDRTDTVTSASPSIPDAAEFERKHRMTGSVIGGHRASVMVDDKRVLVGQAIDGYRLVAVARGLATFQRADGGRAVLRIEEPGK